MNGGPDALNLRVEGEPEQAQEQELNLGSPAERSLLVLRQLGVRAGGFRAIRSK